MEVLDKINAPSFGMQDMELLGLFARQAYLAIAQAQTIEHLDRALLLGLKQLAGSGAEKPSDSLLAALEAKGEAESQNDLIKLVDLLIEFSRLGENERETAIKILQAFAEYGQAKRRLSFGANRR